MENAHLSLGSMTCEISRREPGFEAESTGSDLEISETVNRWEPEFRNCESILVPAIEFTLDDRVMLSWSCFAEVRRRLRIKAFRGQKNCGTNIRSASDETKNYERLQRIPS
jgi:hypothetical protein